MVGTVVDAEAEEGGGKRSMTEQSLNVPERRYERVWYRTSSGLDLVGVIIASGFSYVDALAGGDD